ncbi:hypothetical protein KA405_03880 [Patescibacteria group bacterium]|nr:hypothetical protein [Patescibacteria group bacterium]
MVFSVLLLFLFTSCGERKIETETAWPTGSSYDETGIDHDTIYDPAPDPIVEQVREDTLLVDTYDVSHKIPVLTGYLQKKGQSDSTEFLLLVVNTDPDFDPEQKQESLIYEQTVVIKGSPSLDWLLAFKTNTPLFNYEIEDGGSITQLQFGTMTAKKLNKLDVITQIKTVLEKNETKLLSVKLL